MIEDVATVVREANEAAREKVKGGAPFKGSEEIKEFYDPYYQRCRLRCRNIDHFFSICDYAILHNDGSLELFIAATYSLTEENSKMQKKVDKAKNMLSELKTIKTHMTHGR